MAVRQYESPNTARARDGHPTTLDPITFTSKIAMAENTMTLPISRTRDRATQGPSGDAQSPSGDAQERPYQLSQQLKMWRDEVRELQMFLRRTAQVQAHQNGNSEAHVPGEEASVDTSNADVAAGSVKETVEIMVGLDTAKETFIMDKQALCASSRFFNSILSGTWREAGQQANDNKVCLKNVEHATFEQFTMFLSVPDSKQPPANLAILLDYDAIAKLYVFARRYLVNGLQDLLVDTFRYRLQVVPQLLEPATVSYIQKHAGENSKLLLLLMHYTGMTLVPYMDRSQAPASMRWYHGITTDISKTLFRRTRVPPSPIQWQAYLQGPCRWHVHDDGVLCEQEHDHIGHLKSEQRSLERRQERSEARRKRSLSISTTLVLEARKRSNLQMNEPAGPDLSTARDTRLQTPPPEDSDADPADSVFGDDDEE
ncbi:hypothetical protein LTR78_003971 [Recurvomyces mirabilis]|uniref:BTB domain-containing protein n=1 Tax=Recurvomyces mirabilis TaxID=574656 RepID=A0AAE0WQW3_9PEZI|nr:hypothetical protein LTR78_003971 [Recurvomyces mirabilis]KAK5153891.1 hypothetical protein LTS14_007111 [Recurvomyces mirabilis]